jgi:cyclic peptide transporter
VKISFKIALVKYSVRIIAVVILFLLICWQFQWNYLKVNAADPPVFDWSASTRDKIEHYIQQQMKESKIPGMSVAIVKDGQAIFKQGFGFADLEQKKAVDTNTLFELGSNSKAFTALGIFQLEEKGIIRLDDPVSKYIPWLKMKYDDQEVEITISQLLYQTSGIPFNTIGDIPETNSDTALEETVRRINGRELENYPGEKFLYATINYDILGLVIQEVSKQSFEEYMEENILKSFNLNDVYVSRSKIPEQYMSKGYKIGFGRAREYAAPIYRGNIPAGYFISNADGVTKWLQIQLGYGSDISLNEQILAKSHLPDRTVSPGADDASYSGGWFVYQEGKGVFAHGGQNPNFSSHFILIPDKEIGIAVLANMDSSYTQATAEGIVKLLQGSEPEKGDEDFYQEIDRISLTMLFVIIPLICVGILLIINYIIQLIRKQRKVLRIHLAEGFYILLSLGFVFLICLCIYYLPGIFYYGLSWDFVKVWGSASTSVTAVVMLVFIAVYFLFFFITFLTHNEKDKQYFAIVMLSIISGLGNSLVVFVINQALNYGDTLESRIFLYFILGIVLYVLGQKLVRTKMVTITNHLVYYKRMELIDKILKTKYQKLEEIEQGRLYASLNNDTEAISNFANIVITGATHLMTMICCFVYLGTISLLGLLVTLLVIFLAALLYLKTGRAADKLWTQTRDIQNVFFQYIDSLLNGFKELSLHQGKRDEFHQDMQEKCYTYREKRIIGDLKFTNVFVIGELLFTMVIGAVTFVFPLLFHEFDDETKRNFVFILLYLTGPLNGVLNTMPGIVQIRINWSRLSKLIEMLTSSNQVEQKEMIHELPENISSLQLQGIEYQYKNTGNETFVVGPIDIEFAQGEIVFITGGNGSGKSTLAKLITGLYEADGGKMLVNGQEIAPELLGQMFATVFSDFYLFDRLYGVQFEKKKDQIKKYLRVLGLENKLEINNGIFSTTKLSMGQRKRLALLISYLEERPIYLFDEWAADQDPEFRKFFYEELLQDMKKEGKCVIAITHDEHYFTVADRIIKLDMGKIEHVTVV